MTYALEVNSLNKKIRSKQILNNIDFKIEYGETLGIIGKNGAGKTSIIKCITGLWKMDSGQVKICGYDLDNNFTKCMDNLAALVEYPKLFYNYTLLENINYFCSFYPEIKLEEIEEKLTFFNLQDFKNNKIKTFSSGMHQKACLLIILLRNPKLLILDEPSSMLDPKFAFEIRSLLNQLKINERISILISSHNLNEIESLCDRVLVIDNGAIINTIRLTVDNKYKTYALVFSDSEAAEDVKKLASKDYNITHKDNKLFLHESAERFRKFIIEYNPSFIELSVDGNLEKEFLSSLKEWL